MPEAQRTQDIESKTWIISNCPCSIFCIDYAYLKKKLVLSQRGAPRARASWRRGTTGREERSANTVSTPTIVFTCNWNWLHCNEKTFYSLLRKKCYHSIAVLLWHYDIFGTMVLRYNGIIKVLCYYPEKILFAEAENGGSKQREKLVVRKVFKII